MADSYEDAPWKDFLTEGKYYRANQDEMVSFQIAQVAIKQLQVFIQMTHRTVEDWGGALRPFQGWHVARSNGSAPPTPTPDTGA